MTSTQTQWFLLGASAVLLLLMILIIIFAPASNTVMSGAGGALTVITLLSLGIERVIEAFWTSVGLTLGAWWPLGAISQAIQNLATNLNMVLAPFYQHLENAAETLKNADGTINEEYTTAKQEIADFKGFVNQLTKLAPGSPQGLALANTASQLISNFQLKYSTLDAVAGIAKQAIGDFSACITAPTDNLGRRLISLFVGVFLGLVVAGIFGLDMVQSIFQSSTLGGVLSLHLGIVLTGVVVGLGSSPTHEVIQILQQWKAGLKAAQN